MSDTDENASTPWETLVEVGAFPTLAEAHEHGLVILAMGEACWVARFENREDFYLYAEPEAAPRMTRELSAYDLEQKTPAAKTPPKQEVFRFSAGWDVIGIWVFLLLMAFYWQNKNPALAERATSSSIGLIANHDWWRPFTALFLHADVQHLLGNILSGVLFGSLVSRSIGPWRGWAMILACGTLGNTISCALVYPSEFISLGASTAVFGALGILSGIGFAAMLRSRLRMPLAKTTAPLLAGIILLGLIGSGSPGGNTDVLGHVFGFASGIIAGLTVGHFTRSAEVPTAG